LDRLAVLRDGYRVYDGPAVLDVIKRWDKAFRWGPENKGALIHDARGRLFETSTLVKALLRP
jgi:hypothetical protein